MKVHVEVGKGPRGQDVLLVTQQIPIDLASVLRAAKAGCPKLWRDVDRELILPNNMNGVSPDEEAPHDKSATR